MATKTENGMSFPAEAYAYVPDAKDPSSWKLRLWETPEKKVTAAQVGRAVAAIGKGFRGQKVQIPDAARAGVMAKLRAAWKKANPDKKPADAPAALKEAATEELGQIGDLVCDAIGDLFQAQAATSGSYEPWAIEALFPDRVIVYRDGRYWAYDYTIGEDNSVALTAAGEVLESFTPVGAGAAAAMQEATIFLESKDAEGKVWDAVLIRAGTSKNGTYYPDAVLREAAPLFEGVRVFAVPDMLHLSDPAKKRDVNQLAGWISEPRFIEGARTDSGYIGGRVNIAGQAPLREKLVDAWQRGKRDLVGLSIDAGGTAKPYTGAGAKRMATRISKVESVDLIVEPSAGGALVRLAEAADTSREQDAMKEKMLVAIKAKFPNLDTSSLNDEQILARYAEAIAPAPANRDDRAGTPLTREDFDAYVKLQEARAAAAVKINATTLPAPAKAKLVARFNGLARFTEADLDNEIKAERDYVVRMAESLGADAGKVRMNAGDIVVEDRSKRIAHMLDAFFNPGGKDAEGKLFPAVHSFKECYIEVTGDSRVTGLIQHADRSRLAESVGAAFREGLDTTAFANVLGASLNRRLVQDYNNTANYDGYRLITGNPVPLADFRTQERVRFGGFGDLPIVAESGAYLDPDDPTDEKATYAPQKRGRVVSVTLEMIKNDDVGAIRKIPQRVGRAAKRTLAKFVFDFVATNPLIYDGVNFFAAGHGNLGAAALDATSLAARRLAMLKQTELNSGDPLNIGPATILVPVDLQEAAYNLQQRGTNLDKTFTQSLILNIVPVWYWTDTNDWALFADPADVQCIELGFLDGQQDPELFVQDMPNVGSMFSNDEVTYKLRHIYGGAVVEFRGADKSVV